MKKVKLIIIFMMLLMYSCTIKKERKRHSNLLQIEITDSNEQKTKEKLSQNSTPEVILGALQFRLDNNDQKVDYLNTLITSKNINKEVKSGKSEEAEDYTTYLGQIKLNEKAYHVFKQFYTVQAAIEEHGHSVIIFKDKFGASYYDMELPDDLPIDLTNGLFRFKHINDTLLMKIEYISENDLILRNTQTPAK